MLSPRGREAEKKKLATKGIKRRRGRKRNFREDAVKYEIVLQQVWSENVIYKYI